MNDEALPDVTEGQETPLGLVWHWTAGGHQSTLPERRHYHWLIEHVENDPLDPTDDEVRIVAGVPPENNLRRVGPPTYHEELHPDGYGAHVARWNSRRLGVALCGMRDAVDRRPGGDVDPGPSPITRRQVLAMVSLSISMAAKYGLEPVPEDMCTHYEVESIHGIDQDGKWNVTWIPGSGLGRDEVGGWLRKQVRRGLDGKSWSDALDVRGERAEDQVSDVLG